MDEHEQREYLLQRGWPPVRVERMSGEYLHDVCSVERLVETLQADHRASDAREATIAELVEATVTLADFAGHDSDCGSLRANGCTCGYEDARRRFERARRQVG